MSGKFARPQDVDIDLQQLFRAVYARRKRLLIATVAVSALAFAGATAMTPSYRSESRLLIEPRAAAFSRTDQSAQDTQPLLDELNIASQVQVLQSADLIQKVITDLKLVEREEFTKGGSLIKSLLAKVGLAREEAPAERVIRNFIEKLTVFQVEKSRVIGLQFVSQDPAIAASVPNAMMQSYLALQSGAKIDSNSEATRWLEPEIEQLRAKVEAAEKKVAEYRSKSDLLPTSDSGSFAMRQLNDISTELAKVRADRANAQARADTVRTALKAGRTAETLPDVISSPMIQRLKESEANIQNQISDLSTTMLSGHPRIKALKAQIAGVRTQILDETRKILASIEGESKVAQLREEDLLRQIGAAKADSARAGEDEVGLKALEREAAAQRQLLETYLSRYREAASRSGKNSSPADARVISQAVPPSEPAFPKVGPIVGVAAFATFVLGAMWIMLAELFSGRALRPLEAEGEATPIGLEPRSRPLQEDEVPADMLDAALIDMQSEPVVDAAEEADTEAEIVADEANDEIAAQVAAHADDDFSVLAVARQMIARESPVTAVISPDGDVGSALTVSLARMLADKGRTVILIDMTGTTLPTVQMADQPRLPGITDLLAGSAAFGETIHPDRESSAHIMPHGIGDTELAMRGAERLTMIVDALADAYQHVIVECGAAPVTSVSRLGSLRPANLVVSLPEPDEARLETAIAECTEAGFEDVVLMCVDSPGRNRSAVAA